jgi:hypothetical protein
MENKMDKDNLKHLMYEDTKGPRDKELNELERLAEKFGKKFSLIDIQGDFVYGCINGKREYLGSLAQYSRYKKLNSKYKNNLKKSESQNAKDEAYKIFLESRGSHH